MAETEYKNTLHLPQTDFPMRAELAKREPAWLEAWTKQNLYHAIQKDRAATQAPTFVLHDGPPYANGTLHVGHAANKILKDIVLKSRVLSGYRTPYVPGWDCHGLPIELVVEKKWGKPGKKLTVAAFRQKCREYATEQIKQQREDFKRLGVLGDWDHPYVTMDHAYEAEQIRTLAQIYQNGHIQKGYKPVHWCLDCGSSLAEAEVEYQNKVSDSIYVKFKSLQGDILIWTTTPWTLPANMAVSAGADIVYVKVRINNETYLVAETLLESTFNDGTIEILESFTGKQLAGLQLKHPFENREVPLILGSHVTTDAGTGFVHTAPAHGVDDFKVCQAHALEIYNPVGSNGCYITGTPFFEGVHVSKANDLIIAKLEEMGSLYKRSKLQHSYPHCWRHKTPLIFRATPQWFISMDRLLPSATEAAKQVQFTPPEGETRFLSMLADRPDWCISRQRTWGVPIPFFTHKETGALHPDTVSLLEKVAAAIQTNGLEAWFGASAEDFGVDSQTYDKATDTLDVWFDSGTSNQCVLLQRPELEFPADLYLEGSDQHRGWFQTSLLTAMAATGSAPYRHILTHGFLVDGNGRKMSKSLGNVVTIQEAVKEYGADMIRLWVAMTDFTGEMAFSKQIMKQTADLYRKIRNTLRYLLAALHDFKPETALPLDELIELDAFMIQQANHTQAVVCSHLENYAIRDAMAEIHLFCENDLSNVYFDVLKDRLYTENNWNRRSAQTALYHILQYLIRMITPVLSFTAYEVWHNIQGPDTPFSQNWYTLPKLEQRQFKNWQAAWPRLKEARSLLNRQLDQMRKNQEIGSNLEAEVTLFLGSDTFIKQLAESGELKYFFIVSTLKASSKDQDSIISKSTDTKCARCWHHCKDVGQHTEHPLLCGRCVANINGQGQKRRYF